MDKLYDYGLSELFLLIPAFLINSDRYRQKALLHLCLTLVFTLVVKQQSVV